MRIHTLSRTPSFPWTNEQCSHFIDYVLTLNLVA